MQQDGGWCQKARVSREEFGHTYEPCAQNRCAEVRLVNGDVVCLDTNEWRDEKTVVTTFRNGDPDKISKEVLASIKQIPLILAWAVTIHKAQGMTLDCMIADISRSFAFGQAHVAISRAVSLEGLYLRPFSKKKLQVFT